MRIWKAFFAVLAAALPAAAAPVLLRVPELAFTPSCPLIAPAAASALSPLSLVSLVPAGLAPSLIPAPVKLAPAPEAAVGGGPAIIRALGSAASIGDAPGGKRDEEPDAHFAKFFDGVAAPVEGSPVHPRVATADGPTFRQPLHLTAIQHAVRRSLTALRESVALGQWSGPHTTLDESCCGDAAPKLALLLRAQGVPARLVEAEFHYYVILDLPDGQIVVDPTVRQFFGRKRAPRGVPQVFVGSIAELHALFQRYASVKTTSYGPARIYFSEAVVREDALRAYEEKVRAGAAADHEPLRRFLGIPSAPPPPPGLIVL